MHNIIIFSNQPIVRNFPHNVISGAKFDTKPFGVRVDYTPQHVDLAAPGGGKYVELVNLVLWEVGLYRHDLNDILSFELLWKITFNMYNKSLKYFNQYKIDKYKKILITYVQNMLKIY